MMTDDEMAEQAYDDGFAQDEEIVAYKAGYRAGFLDGRDEGFDTGYDEGYEDADPDGRHPERYNVLDKE